MQILEVFMITGNLGICRWYLLNCSRYLGLNFRNLSCKNSNLSLNIYFLFPINDNFFLTINDFFFLSLNFSFMHSCLFLQFIQLSFYIFSLESNLFFTNFFLNNLFFHFVDLNL